MLTCSNLAWAAMLVLTSVAHDSKNREKNM